MVWEVDEEEGEKIRFATEVTACIKARERERGGERSRHKRDSGREVGRDVIFHLATLGARAKLPSCVPCYPCLYSSVRLQVHMREKSLVCRTHERAVQKCFDKMSKYPFFPAASDLCVQ